MAVTEVLFVPSLYVIFHGPVLVKLIFTEGGTAPTQTVPPPLTIAVGNEFTVTVETAVLEQPSAVPVTVKGVVVFGDASAVFTPVEVAPAVHVYEVAPVAVKFAVCPTHTEGELTTTTGNGLTVTVDTAVPEQPKVVPVTV